MLSIATSPMAAPGVTMTCAAPSLNCRPLAGAEYEKARSSHIHPLPRPSSLKTRSSPTMRPVMAWTPSSRNRASQERNTVVAARVARPDDHEIAVQDAVCNRSARHDTGLVAEIPPELVAGCSQCDGLHRRGRHQQPMCIRGDEGVVCPERPHVDAPRSRGNVRVCQQFGNVLLKRDEPVRR